MDIEAKRIQENIESLMKSTAQTEATSQAMQKCKHKHPLNALQDCDRNRLV